MAIEEKVVQSQSESEAVTPSDQSVTETPQPPVDAIKKQYEEQISQLQKKLADNDTEWSSKFTNLKSKLDYIDK